MDGRSSLALRDTLYAWCLKVNGLIVETWLQSAKTYTTHEDCVDRPPEAMMQARTK